MSPAIKRVRSTFAVHARNSEPCSSSSARYFRPAAICCPTPIVRNSRNCKTKLPRCPASAIAEVIREDLGEPPENLFAFFDSEPLVSPSIVHVPPPRPFYHRNIVL